MELIFSKGLLSVSLLLVFLVLTVVSFVNGACFYDERPMPVQYSGTFNTSYSKVLTISSKSRLEE